MFHTQADLRELLRNIVIVFSISIPHTVGFMRERTLEQAIDRLGIF